MAFVSVSYGATNQLKSEIKAPQSRYSFDSSYSVELGQTLEDGAESMATTLYTGLEVTKNSDKTYAALNIYYDQELTRNDNREGSAGTFRDLYADIGVPLKLVNSEYLEGQKIVVRTSLGNSDASIKKEKKSSLGLIYQFTIPNRFLKLAQYHRITRSFYTTETTDTGSINNPLSYRYLTDLIYTVSKDIKLRATYVYDLHQSFQGVLKDGVITDFKAYYLLNKDNKVFIGVASVGMSTKEADGSTDRLPILDEKKPTVYLGMSGNF